MQIRLKELMEIKGLNVNQLSGMTGLSRTTLTPLTKVDVVPEKTRVETLERIAIALEISLAELVSFERKIKVIQIFKLPDLSMKNKDRSKKPVIRKVNGMTAFSGLALINFNNEKLLISFLMLPVAGIKFEIMNLMDFEMVRYIETDPLKERDYFKFTDFANSNQQFLSSLSYNDFAAIAKTLFKDKILANRFKDLINLNNVDLNDAIMSRASLSLRTFSDGIYRIDLKNKKVTSYGIQSLNTNIISVFNRVRPETDLDNNLDEIQLYIDVMRPNLKK